MVSEKNRQLRFVKEGQSRGQSAHALRKSEPHHNEMVTDVVDEVVSTLVQLTRVANMEITLQVGEIVVNRIFGGLEALHQRGPKDASFRKLAAHPRLPFSAVTLWRAVAIYELVQRLPGFAKAKHLGVAHLRAALGLPPKVQEQVLRAAEIERWTKERIEEAAAKYRVKGEERRGRRPLPPALRCIRQLDRLILKEAALPARLDVAGLDDANVHDIEQRLERIRAWCAALEGSLATRRAGVMEEAAATPHHGAAALGAATPSRPEEGTVHLTH